MTSSNRRLAAIMFSDIEGYTSMMQKDELVGLAKAKKYRSILDELVKKYNGEVLNHYGDGSLTMFDSALNAVKCAQDFQFKLIKGIEGDQSSLNIPVRIGLHVGDIVIEDNDIFGNGVNVASRLESLGQAGTVLFSHNIYEKIKSFPEFKIVSLGKFHFKNVDEPMEVFGLSNPPLVIPKPGTISGKLQKSIPHNRLPPWKKKWVRGIGSVLLLAAAVILTWDSVFSNLFKSEKQKIMESIRSLAVLPFEDYSGSDNQEFWVDGMFSALTLELGQLEALRVISKTSARSYANTEKNIQEIATELKVDAVIETSVLQLGDSIKVQLNMVNAFPEEVSLWSNTFSVVKSDILNLYSDITKNIAKEINFSLSPMEEQLLTESKPVNPEVYELYLKGTLRMGNLTLDGQQDAILYFERALQLDDEFAPAHAAIGGVWAILKQMDFVTPDEADPNIEKHLTNAITLDSTLAEVYYYKAIKNVWTDFDWEAGENAFKKAIEINPNLSNARALFAHYLMTQNRWEECRTQMDIALEIDPLNPFVKVLNTVVLVNRQEFEIAIQELEALEVMMPNNPLVAYGLMEGYARTGQESKSLQRVIKVITPIRNAEAIQVLKSAYEQNGYKYALNATADFLAAGMEANPTPTQMLFTLYALAENKEKTLYWVERNFIRRDPTMPYIAVINVLRPFHNESRFQAVVNRMGLETKTLN